MSETLSIEELENQLNDFNRDVRETALNELICRVEQGAISLPAPGDWVNAHCHTFYSYNPYDYSPLQFAWLARKEGLKVAGIVDFDVLDGIEEFFKTSQRLGIKGIAGMETRVFLPSFSDRVINSPGEPGISYHMGAGIPVRTLGPDEQAFLDRMKETAAQRNQNLISRVNPFTAPVALNYEQDVLPLTPNGNATERHICKAYTLKSLQHFNGDRQQHEAFWADKLELAADDPVLADDAKLQLKIRSKTMKRGGVGYVQPDGGSFPTMEEVNRFVKAAGGIPMMTWLSGESDGEQAIEELLDAEMNVGTAAVNIIPDRNYTPGETDQKLANLQDIVRRCEARDLPVIAGTEMNAPGLKFVDDFSTDELKPLLPVFLKGTLTVYGHTLLEQAAGLGYLSNWAEQHFPDRAARNAFYHAVGQKHQPGESLPEITDDNVSPDEILTAM